MVILSGLIVVFCEVELRTQSIVVDLGLYLGEHLPSAAGGCAHCCAWPFVMVVSCLPWLLTRSLSKKIPHSHASARNFGLSRSSKKNVLHEA